MLYFTFLSLLFAHLFSFSHSSSNLTDQSALLDFKNQITNTDNVLASNWKLNTSFCNWIGVTCSPRTQRVTALNLRNLNLQGTISPSIANLSSLVNLDLTNNSFRGKVPFSLFQSSTLQVLSLAYNTFSGDLWGTESWHVPELRVLNLTANNFTGSIYRSIGNLTRLERLSLLQNNFEGTIPGEIGNLSNIIELDFDNNHFTGSIPSSIFNISSLRTLYLAHNSLSGSFLLPGEDSLRLNLEVIDISGNSLTGQIPSSFCRFPELRLLYFSYNNLTGQIPRNIDCLSNLERLYMTGNNIGGTIPPTIGNISSLRSLGCVENSIGGNIPHELGNLLNLQMLGFDFNNLTGEIPPAIFNLSSLVYIAFSSNSLTGRITSTVGLYLPNLEGIFLPDNLLEGEFPRSIANASRLQQLELSYNSFVGTVPNNLGNLRDLVFLNIANNQLTNDPGIQELDFFNSLVGCKMLQYLIVGNNPLNGFLPESVQNLSSSIQMFNMENAQIYGEIPRGLGNISNMIQLSLHGNNLTGNIPSEVGYLTRLQRLDLSRNRLNGVVPLEICNLVKLGEATLAENGLSGSIPSCIGNLGRLERLDFGYNSFTSTLPLSLWRISGLLYINVTQNSIQGELPHEIGTSPNIEGIDLSSNLFVGAIPSSMGELGNLRYLILSNNSFDDSIPTSFGDLISLEILDISLNSLSGSIPTSLGNLSYLHTINVSYNNLEGQVPRGGVFSNCSRESFKGNRDLCGMTFLEIPSCATTRTSTRSRSRNCILRITIPIAASVALVVILQSLWILRKQKKVKLEDPEKNKLEIVNYQMISYYELYRGTYGFSEEYIIGVGGSSTVYRVTLSSGKTMAVKVIDLKAEESRKRFDVECEVLKQMRHRNLVKVITTCANYHWRSIVLQYMENGSLENWLYKHTLDLLQRIEIMYDVARAVEYLHHGYHDPVVHCDLKPGNVLLDSDMVAYVSDFGISKILAQDSSATKTLGTIGYIAPEYGSEGIVSTAGDVYSFGILLIEVVTRRRPTDEMFSDKLSLRQWVRAAFPSSLVEVVDASLVQQGDELFDNRHTVCITSAIELALDCSMEVPGERVNMMEAAVRLAKIKETFMDNKIN